MSVSKIKENIKAESWEIEEAKSLSNMGNIKVWLITVFSLLCCTTTSAYDFEVDGIYYEKISGSSNCVKVAPSLSKLSSTDICDLTYSGDIVIPQNVEYDGLQYTVLQIGSKAFMHCDSLKSITLNDYITRIEDEAFYGCISLKFLEIPQSVIYIGYNIVFGCSNLDALILEDGIERIALYSARPFNGAPIKKLHVGRQFDLASSTVFKGHQYTPLAEVTINVGAIDEQMFSNCIIQNLRFGEKVEEIATNAFRECTFSTLVIPQNVNSIGNGAFYNSTISKIVIEDSATPLTTGYYSASSPLFFKTKIDSLYLGRNLSYADPKVSPYILPAFSCSNTLKHIIIGDSVTELGDYCFRTMYIEDLEYVFGCNIERIGYSCFGNTLLEEFEVPNSVKYIDNYAIEGGRNLLKVIIPESVVSIGEGAFSSCPKVAEFVIRNPTPFPVPAMSNFSTTAILIVPNGSAKAYREMGGFWGQFASIKEEVNINISEGNKWSTCALAFDAELPEGVRAFASMGMDENFVMLEEVMSLKANTPYVLYAKDGYEGLLAGTVDLSNYQGIVSYGALNGAIIEQSISEGYVLQNQGNGSKFYNVSGQTFNIPAGKCWLSAFCANGARSVMMRFPDDVTDIEGVYMEYSVEGDGKIYTLDGLEVKEMRSGHIYIMDGKKVLKR